MTGSSTHRIIVRTNTIRPRIPKESTIVYIITSCTFFTGEIYFSKIQDNGCYCASDEIPFVTGLNTLLKTQAINAYTCPDTLIKDKRDYISSLNASSTCFISALLIPSQSLNQPSLAIKSKTTLKPDQFLYALTFNPALEKKMDVRDMEKYTNSTYQCFYTLLSNPKLLVKAIKKLLKSFEITERENMDLNSIQYALSKMAFNREKDKIIQRMILYIISEHIKKNNKVAAKQHKPALHLADSYKCTAIDEALEEPSPKSDRSVSYHF